MLFHDPPRIAMHERIVFCGCGYEDRLNIEGIIPISLLLCIIYTIYHSESRKKFTS
jgi:hypothetical protein